MAFGQINPLSGNLLAGIINPTVANPGAAMQESAANTLAMQNVQQQMTQRANIANQEGRLNEQKLQENDAKLRADMIQSLYFDAATAVSMPYDQRQRFFQTVKTKYANSPDLASNITQLEGLDDEKQVSQLLQTVDILSKAGFGLPKEEKKTTNIQEAEYATGGEGQESREIVRNILNKKGDPTTKVNIGDRIPAGYFKDEKSGELKPIPGGPIDTEYRSNVNRLAQNVVAGKQHASNVFDLIDESLGKVDEFRTGIPGKITGLVPGTQSYILNQTLDTIKANLSFDKLNEMREMSKTGGALGQVSERELSQLERAMRSLEQGQDKETLVKNLEAVRAHYTNWLNNLTKFSRENANIFGATGDQWKSLTHTKWDNRKASDDEIDTRLMELRNQGMSDSQLLRTLIDEGYPVK